MRMGTWNNYKVRYFVLILGLWFPLSDTERYAYGLSTKLCLTEAKNIASQASTAEDQAKLKIEHLQKELKEKQGQSKNAEKENKGLLSELEKARKEKRDLEVSMEILNG